MVKTKFQIETDCINQLAFDGYGLTVRKTVSADMRTIGTNLVEVRRVLAEGVVTHSDMVEDRGRWVVRGNLVDGGQLTVTVLVRSADYDVEIVAVT